MRHCVDDFGNSLFVALEREKILVITSIGARRMVELEDGRNRA